LLVCSRPVRAAVENDENILILGDLDSTDADSIKKQKKLARFARAEINRLIKVFGVRFNPNE